MEDIIFKDIKELYNRLLPALKSKKKMIIKEGYYNIKEQDIWEYMSRNKWSIKTGLTLYDMVSEIMHEDEKELIKYCELKNNQE